MTTVTDRHQPVSASMMPGRLLAALAVVTFAIAVDVGLRIRGNQPIYAPTGWLFHVGVAGAAILLLELTVRIARPSAATASRLRLVAGPTLLMLLGAEATRRYATPKWATYLERNGGPSLSLYGGEPSWYHIHWPNSP